MTYPGQNSYPGANTYPGIPSGTPDAGGGAPSAPTQWSSPGGELTVTFNTTTFPPRAELKVSWPGASTATITRTDPSNEQFPVRLAEPALLDGSGSWSGADYLLPYGVGVTYTLTSAQMTSSPTVVTGVFDVPVGWQAALIHPQAPSLSAPIILKADALADELRPARQTALVVMNRNRPVVVSDVRGAPSSTLTVWCDTEQQVQALNGVLADGSALWLACDARLGLAVPQVYVAIGDQNKGRPREAPGDFQGRTITLPFQEVDRPAGKFRGGTAGEGGSGFWTYAAAQARYPTYAAAQASYGSYADAALDRVR
jgi:hypothetical protein